MADGSVAIRLSLKDGDVVRRALLQLGEDGQRALERIERAAAPASRGLLALSDVAGGLRLRAEGMAGNLGALGDGLIALGPAGLVAGTALAAVGAALTGGLREMEMADQSMRRLEAVLTSTGHASGLTAGQIGELADEMERTTLATAEGVMDAAAVLATFRSVAGDAFTGALRAAQDMSAVFGQDLRSSAVQLGKALEDPVEGITALRRVGVSFTAAQKDMIAAMVEAGDVAGAQRMILATLEQQVGGAGEAEGRGLTGAAHRLESAWGNLLDTMARTSGVEGIVNKVMDTITRGISRAADAVSSKADVSQQLAAKAKELAQVESEIGQWREGSEGWTVRVRTAERLRREMNDIVDRGLREVEEADKASAGRLAAEQERNAEAQKARLKALEDERVKAARDGAEKVAAINAKLAEDIGRGQARAKLPGVDPADVEKEVSLLRDVAARKVEAIEKPIAEARRRAAEQTAKVLADLERQLQAETDPRGAAIDAARAKLGAGATDAERARAGDLAARAYDQKRAVEDLKAAVEEEAKVLDKGRWVTEQFGDAGIVAAARQRELADLLKSGAIDADTYARATEDAERKRLDASMQASDGIKRALMDIREASQDTAAQWAADVGSMNNAARNAFVGIASGANTLAEGLQGLLQSIEQTILGRVYDRSVGLVVDSMLNSFFGAKHGGGLVGEGGLARQVSPLVFAGAPRFHGGGLVGDEMPIIARRGERVLTEAQQDNTATTIANLAAMASVPPQVNVVINNSAPSARARAQVVRGSGGGIEIAVIVEELERMMGRNVARGEGLAGVFESRYGLDPAAGALR